MLKIPQPLFNDMVVVAKKSFPHECCGVMVGTMDAAGLKTVKQVVEIENLNKERAHDRYHLDPKGFMRAEREAGKQGLSIVGIFHSHPDHPSKASETDRLHAWPVYSYLIIAIHKGEYHDHRNWILTEDGGAMVEEECTITA